MVTRRQAGAVGADGAGTSTPQRPHRGKGRKAAPPAPTPARFWDLSVVVLALAVLADVALVVYALAVFL
mgnify:CR=1 FL=1